MANKVLYIKRNDTLPRISCEFTNNGTPVDITGATVTFRMRSDAGGDLKVDEPAEIVNASLGQVRYTFVTGDTDTLGNYYVEWFIDGLLGTETVPNSTYNVIVVLPSLLDTVEDEAEAPVIVTGPAGAAGPTGPQGPPGVTATTANIDLYVSTSGNDANPGTIGSPLATLQAAVNTLAGLRVKHTATINMAPGSYAGAFISDITTSPSAAPSIDHSYVAIKGAMALSTLATGTNTGTLTGSTATSAATFATISDSGQSWTVNNLRGKYVEILTGTGSTATVANPAIHLIDSNTATSLSIVFSGTLPTAGATYRIIEPSVFITSALTPASQTGNAANAPLAGAATGMVFTNNRGAFFSVSQVQFTLGASLPRAVATGDNRVRFSLCRFVCSAGTAFVFTPASTNMFTVAPVLYGCYFEAPSGTGTMLNYGSTVGGMMTSPSVSSCVFNGGLTAYSAGGSATGPLINNCSFRSFSNIALSISNSGAGQVNGCRFDANAYAIRTLESSSSGLGTMSFGFLNCDISNSTASAVSLQGAFTSAYLSNTSGSGNLVALQISRGSKVVVASNVTLTGTTEVSIDGASNTLAAMRAASPKIIKNADYLTAYYE